MHPIFSVLLSLACLTSTLSAQTTVRARSKEPTRPIGAVESSPWYAQVSDEVRRGEYAFQPLADEPGVWSAPNRSQEFRSRVSCEGVDVFPRTTSADGIGAAWTLRLRTTGFGRGGDVRALAVSSISTTKNRVELDHGLLQEWFENKNEGLEQGWTITSRPSGVESLWIGLEFGDDLSLRIDAGARSGVLVDASGQAQMRYRDLVVFDATGRELPARLAPSPSGLGIQIDDARALYPLTVDPVLTGLAWTAESDQDSAQFGYSVATAGDVNGDGYSDVIVGAPTYDNGEADEGRAFVYLGSGAGLATSAAWTAESDQADAQFAYSVATAGDVNGDGYSDVIVGAPNHDNDETDEGRAFVYLGSVAGLATSAAWTAESDQASANLGWSVATAGDVDGDGYSDVIVGAVNYDGGRSQEGRAFVYLGSGAGLATSFAWTAESDQAIAQFGFAVAPAGDVNGDGYGDVIVGAPDHDNGQTAEGRAFVYLGSGAGLATSAAWTAESDQAGAKFGFSVATAGDVNGDGYGDVIVGALYYDDGETDEGRAFVYLGSGAGLSTSAAWTAESDQASAYFGWSVATAGDVNGDGFSDVIVGALYYSNGESGEGRAFVYQGSSLGLATSATWTAESDQAGALFGSSVSTAGDVNGDGYSDVIVGALSYTSGESGEGRAFVYQGSPLGLATIAASTAESNQAGSLFGISVESAGDVNGDGFSDVIVGAYLYDNGQTDEGRAFVYLGSGAGLAASAAWTAESDQNGAFFGWSVATAGDVNGDGYSDVIVGAYAYDNGQSNEGRAFVYLGSSTGLAASAAWTAESNQANALFGNCVATAGDVNGDGYSEVIIGSYLFTLGQTDEGIAVVYMGSATGPITPMPWAEQSNQISAFFGSSVASAGDVNGDGFGDVIIGAPGYDNGQMDEGRAFVYLGSVSGLSHTIAWSTESEQVGALYGTCVASAGDVNGDGYSDVLVGAPPYDNDQTGEGRAYLYLGSTAGLSASAAWTAESDQSGSNFASSLASAGDVNGDGYSDVIVGAYAYDNGQSNEGRAYVYLGSSTGLATSVGWTAESDQVIAAFGGSVATAGDVNGDGYSDVIVGSYSYSNGQTSEGRTFLYLGNDGRGGWTLAPRQRQASDAAPIGLLGRSGDKDEFRIRLDFERELTGFAWASSLAPKARLEWEVAPLRAALDGSRIESGAEQSITGLPLSFNELAEFAAPGPFQLLTGVAYSRAAGAYHWRARLRTNNPIFPVTPWVSIPWNNVTETKLRVGPLPAAHSLR